MSAQLITSIVTFTEISGSALCTWLCAIRVWCLIAWIQKWIEHSTIFGQFSRFCHHMGFGFLNLGTVNMFISFGRLDYRIQIQLRYYVQHIWTFTILFTLQFFMLFINDTGIHLFLPRTNITYLLTTSVEINILVPAQYHCTHVTLCHTVTLLQILYSHLV